MLPMMATIAQMAQCVTSVCTPWHGWSWVISD